jgi:hypothetical protein
MYRACCKCDKSTGNACSSTTFDPTSGMSLPSCISSVFMGLITVCSHFIFERKILCLRTLVSIEILFSYPILLLIILMFSSWPVCKAIYSAVVPSINRGASLIRTLWSQENCPDKWSVRITESPMIDVQWAAWLTEIKKLKLKTETVHTFCFPGIPSAWWSIRIIGVRINGTNQRIISYWLELNLLPCYVWCWYHPWL